MTKDKELEKAKEVISTAKGELDKLPQKEREEKIKDIAQQAADKTGKSGT